MSKTKALLIISAILVFIGVAIGGAGVALGGTTDLYYYFMDGKFTAASSSDLATASVPVDDFTKIKVNTATVDIRIKQSDNYGVSYHVSEDHIPEVKTSGDKLTVTVPKTSSFFNFRFNSTSEEYIEITVPYGDDYYDIDIDGSTSDIQIDKINSKCNIGVSTGNIVINSSELDDSSKLHVSTGNISLNNCNAEKLHTEGSTGDHFYTRCTIEDLDIDTSTGDVTFSESTIGEVSIDGSTSDIKSTGTSFKKIDISVSTGDVNLSLPGEENDYDYNISLSTGDLNVDGNTYHKSIKRDKGHDKKIIISGSSSDVNISFDK